MTAPGARPPAAAAAAAPAVWSSERGMMVRRFGAGPELVWIHGLGEWSASFDPITHHPALAGFAHTLLDLPGYGCSPWPDTVPENALEVLADQLAAWLAPRPPPFLIGHSMGGVLATLVAERIPARGVVNIDGNLSRGDCTFSAQAAAFSLTDFVAHGFDELRAGVFAGGAEDRALRGYHAALTSASPAMFHRHATELVALSVTETLAGRLVGLRCPSLFIAGVPRGVCEHSRGLLDHHGARWLGIEPAGHWVWIDQPDAFAAATRAFLDEHAGPA